LYLKKVSVSLPKPKLSHPAPRMLEELIQTTSVREQNCAEKIKLRNSSDMHQTNSQHNVQKLY
jgi:hypothetical protein